jgi:hypothetical protein
VSANRPASSRPPSARRQAAERRSAAPLLYLRQLPAWVPPAVLAAFLVAGLAVRGWAGAVLLCVAAAFLGWLAFLSWPGLAVRGRLGRAAAIVLILGLAAFQATR